MKLDEIKQRLDPKCWKGKHKEGTKIKGGVRVNNCVPNESVEEAMRPIPVDDNGNRISDQLPAGKQRRAFGQPGDSKSSSQGKITYTSTGIVHKRHADTTPKPRAVPEAANAAQQAAIAVNMKKHHQKPKGVAEGSQRVDSLVTDALKLMRGSEVRDAVSALKTVLGDREYNQRRGHYNFYIRQMLDMYGQQGVAEDYDSGEYNDEAGMAQGNLHTIAMAAQGLLDTIDDKDNLPEWAQEKIAKVEGMLVTVWNYLQSQEAQGIDPEVEEMYEAMDELAEEMAQKNGVSADLVWETFEAMPDNMLYETAAWRRKEGKSKKGGLNAKGVASYRREHPGSKLQTAVTTKPSKLKPGSKAAKRRKSFCARMSGVKGPMKKPNGKPTRKALALRKWNC